MAGAFCYANMYLDEAVKQFDLYNSVKNKANTARGYSLVLRQFALYNKNCHIEDIDINMVLEWFALMRHLGWDENSFVTKSIALRKFFEFFKRQKYPVLDYELIPVPATRHAMPRILDEANYQKLLTVVPDKTADGRHIRNRAIISMLWDTGARNGEVLSLNLDDIKLEEKRAVIRTEKAKSKRPFREIYWTKKTNKYLKEWLEKREQLAHTMEAIDPQALFISICAGQHATSGRRFGIKGVGEMLRRYSNKAGIETVNAHSFRHHMGRNIVEQGGSNSDVANILGHSSLASTFIYTQLSNKELEQRYRRFVKDKI